MPISLTTPWSPGDFDPGKTYDKVKVIEFTLDLLRMEMHLVVCRGYEDGGAWIDGKDHYGKFLIEKFTIRDQAEIPDNLDENGDPIPDTGSPADPQFSIMVAKLVGSDDTKTIYDRAAEEVYAWIIANVAEYAGTVDS